MMQWPKSSRAGALILGTFTLVIVLALLAAIRFGLGAPGTTVQDHHLPGLTVFQQKAPSPALIVTSVESRSQAEARRIQVGDQILAINGQPVRTLDDVDDIVLNPGRKSLALKLRHNETVRETVLIQESIDSRGT